MIISRHIYVWTPWVNLLWCLWSLSTSRLWSFAWKLSGHPLVTEMISCHIQKVDMSASISGWWPSWGVIWLRGRNVSQQLLSIHEVILAKDPIFALAVSLIQSRFVLPVARVVRHGREWKVTVIATQICLSHSPKLLLICVLHVHVFFFTDHGQRGSHWVIVLHCDRNWICLFQ